MHLREAQGPADIGSAPSMRDGPSLLEPSPIATHSPLPGSPAIDGPSQIFTPRSIAAYVRSFPKILIPNSVIRCSRWWYFDRCGAMLLKLNANSPATALRVIALKRLSNVGLSVLHPLVAGLVAFFLQPSHLQQRM
jgi:hypothetical protein